MVFVVQQGPDAVSLSNVEISYGGEPVVSIPELKLAAGGYTLVTGPTGCGKSSLALALVGVLEELTGARLSGSLRVASSERAGLPGAARSAGIAAVWQHPEAQLFRRTIIDEVRAGLDFQLVDGVSGTARARDALRLVGLDHLQEERDPMTLSGGEQQRLALAAALVLQTPLLVLDEALSQLDEQASTQLRSSIASARAERALTVIAFDHRPDPHLSQADRVIVFDAAGQIALDGTPEQVFRDEADLCSAIGVRLPETSVLPKIHESAVTTAEHAALTVRSIVPRRRRSPDVPQLRNLKFAFPQGAIALLAGPNGSGKSTVLGSLAGANSEAPGGIVPPRRQRRRSGIGYAPQRGSGLFATRSVRDEVTLVRVSNPLVLQGEEAVPALLQRAGLAHLADMNPQHLSGGQRQRLAVLLAVASRPALVLLDEPSNAQDARGAAQVLELIRNGAHERVTIIATHEASLFAGVATHRICLGERGECEAVGP